MIRRSRCSESGGLLRMRMGRASRRSGGLARVGHRQSRARVQRDKQRAAKVRQQQRAEVAVVEAKANALATELERLKQTQRDFKFAREQDDGGMFDLPRILPPSRRH